MIELVFVDEKEGEIINGIDDIPEDVSYSIHPKNNELHIFKPDYDKPVVLKFKDRSGLYKFLDTYFEYLRYNYKHKNDKIVSFSIHDIESIYDPEVD